MLHLIIELAGTNVARSNLDIKIDAKNTYDILNIMTDKQSSNSEDGFDRLARLIKEEGEDVRSELHTGLNDARSDLGGRIDLLESKVDRGFAGVHAELSTINRRLDTLIQAQLDELSHRVKHLETAVFK